MNESRSLSWGAHSLMKEANSGTKWAGPGDTQTHTRCCGLALTGATREGFLEEEESELRNKGLAVQGRQKVGLS